MEGAWTWADGHRDHNPNNHQTNIETFNLQHFNSNKAKIWANEDKLIFPLLTWAVDARALLHAAWARGAPRRITQRRPPAPTHRRGSSHCSTRRGLAAQTTWSKPLTYTSSFPSSLFPIKKFPPGATVRWAWRVCAGCHEASHWFVPEQQLCNRKSRH